MTYADFLPLVLDFLATLDNLREGTRMNHECVKLLAKRRGAVEMFLKGMHEVRGDLREKFQELEKLVGTGGRPNAVHASWKPDASLAHFLQTRVYKDEGSFIGVETGVSPGGWEIRLFSRGRGVPKRPDLEALLRTLGIDFEEGESLVHPARFAYDDDLGRIAPTVQEIVDKISCVIR